MEIAEIILILLCLALAIIVILLKAKCNKLSIQVENDTQLKVIYNKAIIDLSAERKSFCDSRKSLLLEYTNMCDKHKVLSSAYEEMSDRHIKLTHEYRELDCKYIELDYKYAKLKSIKPRKKREYAPKILPPDELVDGEIYVIKDNENMIIRFKLKCAKYEKHYYSCIGANGVYFSNNFFDIQYEGKMYREASIDESKYLIKSEVDHGFFYGLKSK